MWHDNRFAIDLFITQGRQVVLLMNQHKSTWLALRVIITLVGFTRIAVNFKFHSWFANFKLTSSLGCVGTTRGFVTWS